MAYALGPKGTTADKRSVKFEEFVPSSGWTEDASSHYLLVDLPDFRQENVKLDVDDSGYITISGERKISDLKYRRFQLTVKVPEDADVSKMTGKLEGGMLHAIVPKHDKEKEEPTDEEYKDLEDENGACGETEKDREEETATSEDGEHHVGHIGERGDEDKAALKDASNEERSPKGGENSTMLLYIVNKIEMNKGSIAAVVLAFALGVLITRKMTIYD